MINWINVKERLPDSRQEVLAYYEEVSEDIENFEVLTYFRLGDIIDEVVLDFSIGCPELRLLDALFDKTDRTTKRCTEEGFYICEDGWRKHGDVITHWAELVAPSRIGGSNV